ncbi:MAG: heme-binding protein, partial [Bacteroidales bacterium]|nr:heme-binding protein [Bacteroidales bacterium]
TILLLLITNQSNMANIFTQKTETPQYRVIRKLDKVEIRQYPELILASTKMGDSYSGNSGRGFSTVAGYIFGGNEKSEKISMTSPVVVDMADTMKMSFIMPSEYEMEDLPSPSNPKVELQRQSSRLLAVISFGGWASDEKLAEYREVLKAELEKHQIKPKGHYMFMGYNPPYRLINRRNELAVEIESLED